MQESIDNMEHYDDGGLPEVEKSLIKMQLQKYELEKLVTEARTLLRLASLLYIDSKHEDMQESIVEFIAKSKGFVPDEEPSW